MKKQKSNKVRGKLFSLDKASRKELSKEELVTRTLFALGFRINYKGFFYLRDEILLAMDNKNKMITKLHEEVAKKCNEQNPKKQIKASSVESCIRTAIKSAWKNKKEKIKQLTGEKKKPTVGRLVFEIADAINNSDK